MFLFCFTDNAFLKYIFNFILILKILSTTGQVRKGLLHLNIHFGNSLYNNKTFKQPFTRAYKKK